MTALAIKFTRTPAIIMPRVMQAEFALVYTADMENYYPHASDGTEYKECSVTAHDTIVRRVTYTFRLPDTGIRACLLMLDGIIRVYNKFTVDMDTNREVSRLFDLLILVSGFGAAFHRDAANEPLDDDIAVNAAIGISGSSLFHEVLRDAAVVANRDMVYAVFGLVHSALRRALPASKQYIIPGVLLSSPEVRQVFKDTYATCHEYTVSRVLEANQSAGNGFVMNTVSEHSPEFRSVVNGIVERLLWRYADTVLQLYGAGILSRKHHSVSMREFLANRMHAVYAVLKNRLSLPEKETRASRKEHTDVSEVGTRVLTVDEHAQNIARIAISNAVREAVGEDTVPDLTAVPKKERKTRKKADDTAPTKAVTEDASE